MRSVNYCDKYASFRYSYDGTPICGWLSEWARFSRVQYRNQVTHFYYSFILWQQSLSGQFFYLCSFLFVCFNFWALFNIKNSSLSLFIVFIFIYLIPNANIKKKTVIAKQFYSINLEKLISSPPQIKHYYYIGSNLGFSLKHIRSTLISF